MRPAALLPLFALTLTAADPTLDAPIRRVRLHPNEAWITRVGTFPCAKAGTFRVKLKDLPAGLTLDDLKIQVKGPSGTRLGNVSVGSSPREIRQTPAWRTLEQEQKSLKAQSAAITAKLIALDETREFLLRLQANPSAGDPNRPAYQPPDANRLLGLARGLESQLADLFQRQGALRKAAAPIDAQLERIDQAMARLKNQEQRSPCDVKVEFSTGEPGTVEIEVQTRTREARWKPSYEVRLSEDKSSLELVCLAVVSQLSGESWKGVEVEIANAQPSRSLDLPALRSKIQLAYRAPEPPVKVVPANATISIRGSQNNFTQFQLDGLPVETRAISNAASFAPGVVGGTTTGTGTLAGEVRDPNGRPIAGAMLRLSSGQMHGQRSCVTDGQGNFRMSLLPSGSYQLVVSREGYSSSTQNLQIAPGALAIAYPTLTTAALATVEVVASVACDPGDEPAPEPALESGSSIIQEAQGLSRTFRIDGAKDIPSDAQPYRFLLSRARMKPTLRYRCVPQASSDVFLLAEVQPEAQFPWFPGTETAVFRGEQRLGQVRLSAWAPGRPIAFSYGAEPEFRVERQVLEAKTESSGALGRDRAWTMKTEVRIASDLSEPTAVEVLEARVRSTVDKVKVEPLKEGLPEEKDKRHAYRQWTLNIPANGNAHLQQGYRITAPASGFIPELAALGLPESD
jgi:hypothetical protein